MPILRNFIFALLSVLTVTANAAPLTLDLTFTVNNVADFAGNPINPGAYVDQPTIGSKFHAYLRVDNSILSTDGAVRPGKILGFDAQVGATQWNPSLPLNPLFGGGNQFFGFRGPCSNPAVDCGIDPLGSFGLSSQYLGFNVLNGQVIGLRGGVYGPADFPFVDFLDNKFSSLSAFNLSSPTNPMFPYSTVALNGTLTVSEVASIPEPSSIALMFLGAVVCAAFTVRRKAPGYVQDRTKG